MSASFLLLRNSFPSINHQSNGGNGNGFTECDTCLNYDTQTCCFVILPLTATAGFFIWLFIQKGHLALGLVLCQLIAIILLGIFVFLFWIMMRRFWKYLKRILNLTKQTTTPNNQQIETEISKQKVNV
uniref:Uncharacterized protein n=2 Tax=Meloidogyne TaxID=189290 RepID=A0A915NC67_MELJA